MPRFFLTTLALCALSLACSTRGDFVTNGNPFEGTISGAPTPSCTTEPCSFIRRGFAADTNLALELDLNAEIPGSMTATGSDCGTYFSDTVFTRIEPLQHDNLSAYTFPGATVENFIYDVVATGGILEGQRMMAFLSLHRSGVELRLVSGSGERACDPSDCAALIAGQCDLYALFRLDRD